MISPGTRKYPNNAGELNLQAGEYGLSQTDGNWYAALPEEDPAHPKKLVANLALHNITVHDDGTITVSPSILVSSYHGDLQFQWHGYLEQGQWRSCN
jgi:hypothetical protein